MARAGGGRQYLSTALFAAEIVESFQLLTGKANAGKTDGEAVSRVLAFKLAPEIAVNCVAPGIIDFGEKASAKFYRNMAAKTPMRHNGTGDDVAAAVRFLASEEAGFITGHVLAVNGGMYM